MIAARFYTAIYDERARIREKPRRIGRGNLFARVLFARRTRKTFLGSLGWKPEEEERDPLSRNERRKRAAAADPSRRLAKDGTRLKDDPDVARSALRLPFSRLPAPLIVTREPSSSNSQFFLPSLAPSELFFSRNDEHKKNWSIKNKGGRRIIVGRIVVTEHLRSTLHTHTRAFGDRRAERARRN